MFSRRELTSFVVSGLIGAVLGLLVTVFYYEGIQKPAEASELRAERAATQAIDKARATLATCYVRVSVHQSDSSGSQLAGAESLLAKAEVAYKTERFADAESFARQAVTAVLASPSGCPPVNVLPEDFQLPPN